ncbi:hypothetical protein TGDOM2_220585 [Toxoplasma gondii GAB2-2007-GAL-DOM2]|uniref:Uncharacterized protein n=2 Tax=Toxoplasma gondii TaxID=5811 RepID=B9QPT3_TOXGV|nr:hypothetical protein TGVEG_220585 [Toxoplasma gondii VEG]KFG30456.1 hypothetical protein TGDOM2_220585 [Toxoplasma gondii GAB2-2007-GAL-DOM2]CEL72705.1 TPA: hypothetical protein BN1205_086950 [Toxoplasma gondii VEG]
MRTLGDPHDGISSLSGERSGEGGELNREDVTRTPALPSSKRKEGRNTNKSVNCKKRTILSSSISVSTSTSTTGRRRGASLSGRPSGGSSGHPLLASVSSSSLHAKEKGRQSGNPARVQKHSLSSSHSPSLPVQSASLRHTSSGSSESPRAVCSPVSTKTKEASCLRSSASCPVLPFPFLFSSPLRSPLYAPPAAAHLRPPPGAVESLSNPGGPAIRPYPSTSCSPRLAERGPSLFSPSCQKICTPHRWSLDTLDVSQRPGVVVLPPRSSLRLERAASTSFTIPEPPLYRPGSSMYRLGFTKTKFAFLPRYGFPSFRSLPRLLTVPAPASSVLSSDSPVLPVSSHRSSSVSRSCEGQPERQICEQAKGLLAAKSGLAQGAGDRGGENGDREGEERGRKGVETDGETRGGIAQKNEEKERDTGTQGRSEGAKGERVEEEGKRSGGQSLAEKQGPRRTTRDLNLKDEKGSSKSSSMPAGPRQRTEASSRWATASFGPPRLKKASSLPALRNTGDDRFHQSKEGRDAQKAETHLKEIRNLVSAFCRLMCSVSAGEYPHSAWSIGMNERRGREREERDRTEEKGQEGKAIKKREQVGCAEIEDNSWVKIEADEGGSGVRDKERQGKPERKREPEQDEEGTGNVQEDKERTWSSFLRYRQKDATASCYEARDKFNAGAFIDEGKKSMSQHSQTADVRPSSRIGWGREEDGRKREKDEAERDSRTISRVHLLPEHGACPHRGIREKKNQVYANLYRFPSSSFPSARSSCPSASPMSLWPCSSSCLSSWSSPQPTCQSLAELWKLQKATIRVLRSRTSSQDERGAKHLRSHSIEETEQKGRINVRDSDEEKVGVSHSAPWQSERDLVGCLRGEQSRETQSDISGSAPKVLQREKRQTERTRDVGGPVLEQAGRRASLCQTSKHRILSPQNRDAVYHFGNRNANLSPPKPESVSGPHAVCSVSDSSKFGGEMKTKTTTDPEERHSVCIDEFPYPRSECNSATRYVQAFRSFSTRLKRNKCASVGSTRNGEEPETRERRQPCLAVLRRNEKEREEEETHMEVRRGSRQKGNKFEGAKRNEPGENERRSVSELLWEEARKKHRQSLALARDRVAQQRAENARRRKEIATLLKGSELREEERITKVKAAFGDGLRAATSASMDEEKKTGQKGTAKGDRDHHETTKQLQATQNHRSMLVAREKKKTKREYEGADSSSGSDSYGRGSNSSESEGSDNSHKKSREGDEAIDRGKEDTRSTSPPERMNTESPVSETDSSSRSSSPAVNVRPREGNKRDSSSHGDDSLRESNSDTEAEHEPEGNCTANRGDKLLGNKLEAQRVFKGENSSSNSDAGPSTEKLVSTPLERFANKRSAVGRHVLSTSSDDEEEDERKQRVPRQKRNDSDTAGPPSSSPAARRSHLILSQTRKDDGKTSWMGGWRGKRKINKKMSDSYSRRSSKSVHFAPSPSSRVADDQTFSGSREGRGKKERIEHENMKMNRSASSQHQDNSKTRKQSDSGRRRRESFSSSSPSSASSSSSDAPSQESSLSGEADSQSL